MKRRQFVTLALSAAAAWPLVARAQQRRKVTRIGVLTTGSSSDNPDSNTSLTPAALREGLSELGYVDGRNVELEVRTAHGVLARLPALAAELASLPVDIIVAGATPAARAAQNESKTIPIVAIAMGDPVRDGLVASYGAPGGNLTGNTFLGPELVSKRLAVLKELVPSLSRVGVIWHPGAFGEQTMADMLKEAEEAAGLLELKLDFAPVAQATDFDAAVSKLAMSGAQAIFQFPSVMLFSERKQLVEAVSRHRLPAMFNSREFVELGALIAYGASLADLNRRGAGYIDKIIRGAKPSDLPVEQPTAFELLINRTTARALGLTLPASLLARADEVIE